MDRIPWRDQEQLISKQANLGSSFPALGPAMREAVLVESGH